MFLLGLTATFWYGVIIFLYFYLENFKSLDLWSQYQNIYHFIKIFINWPVRKQTSEQTYMYIEPDAKHYKECSAYSLNNETFEIIDPKEQSWPS